MSHRRSTPRGAPTAAAMTAAAVLALGACDGGSGARASGSDGPSVVAPGKPGEPAKTLSADQAAKVRADDTPNSADVRYVRMMIEHHRQALTMTDLAVEHARSGTVRRLAERIAAAQGPEIEAMEGWLTTHGGPKGPAAHGHEAMPGMARTAQLERLRAARGSDFDRLFLKLMITHHQGAVTMATEVLSEGNDALVEEMANDVVVQQTAEISRMRGLS